MTFSYPEDGMSAIHPGEILREEFLEPMNLSSTSLAINIQVPPARITEIVREKRGITADTAFRLARFFGTSPQFWMGLQKDYELASVRSEIYQSITPRVAKEA